MDKKIEIGWNWKKNLILFIISNKKNSYTKNKNKSNW
jgi:hypothetical protein